MIRVSCLFLKERERGKKYSDKNPTKKKRDNFFFAIFRAVMWWTLVYFYNFAGESKCFQFGNIRRAYVIRLCEIFTVSSKLLSRTFVLRTPNDKNKVAEKGLAFFGFVGECNFRTHSQRKCCLHKRNWLNSCFT